MRLDKATPWGHCRSAIPRGRTNFLVQIVVPTWLSALSVAGHEFSAMLIFERLSWGAGEVGEKERHPVYRLIDGRIMCQAQPGARWQLVDDSVADRMLKTFDGLEPGSLTTVQIDWLERQAGLRTSALKSDWSGAESNSADESR
jgi:hypothetical protein